jgi:hypothetical protein
MNETLPFPAFQLILAAQLNEPRRSFTILADLAGRKAALVEHRPRHRGMRYR